MKQRIRIKRLSMVTGTLVGLSHHLELELIQSCSEDLRDAADMPFTLKAGPVNEKINRKSRIWALLFVKTHQFSALARSSRTSSGLWSWTWHWSVDVCPLSLQGPVNHVRTVSIGEKRQPATSTHTTVNKSHALITQATKSTPGSRYAA